MTTTGEPRREPGWLAALRTALLLLLLLCGAVTVPPRWAVLWIAVPVAVAIALLLTWRYGRGGLAFPAALLLAVVGVRLGVGEAGLPLWLAGWLPLAAITGAWMGLHEEGGGPTIGDRMWMLVPLLLLAAALPLMPGFAAAIARLETQWMAAQAQMLKDTGDAPAIWKEGIRQQMAAPLAERRATLMLMVPSMLFLWMALLVSAGRSLAARGATLLKWPPLSRAPFGRWRLPDLALAPLLVGLAMLVLAGNTWHPSAWTLLANVSLGYIVQGVAVVGSLLAARGMPPVFVALTLLFVMVVSLLWVLPAVAVVGLSDVWLDYRRLEPAPEGEA